jgi:putative inorganic carbon (hco3(-)) transporter
MAKKLAKVDLVLHNTTIYSMFVFTAALPFSIALTQISLGLALLSWLFRRFFTKTISFRPLGVEWGILAFILAEVLALLFSTNFSQNIIFLKRLLLIPIVYLFALNISDEKFLKRLLWIFVISVTAYSFAGIISYFLNPTLRVRHIQNSMTAGGITMIGALVSLGMAVFYNTSKWRILNLFFTLIISFCLLLTSTRGSWIGFFIGVLFIFYHSNKKLFAIIPVFILAFYFLGPAAFSDRVKHMFDPTWRTNAKRIFWWSVGWEIFKDRPIVGIGDVSTDIKFKQYAPPQTKELAGHMHNNFIHIAVTLGLIGLTAFIFMIIGFFKALFKVLIGPVKIRGPSKAILLSTIAAFLAFNVNGLFEWNFGDAEIITIIWFLIGISLAIPACNQNKVQKQTTA